MEQVLDVYKRPYDPERPVVCMDESPRQLIRETRLPLALGRGVGARHDFEYERCGVCNVFMAVEPLAGKRAVQITEHRTRTDWAHFLADIAGRYRRALSPGKQDHARDGQSEYAHPGVALQYL